MQKIVRVGDRVKALKGKREGQIGNVTDVGDKVLVQFDGLAYEVPFESMDVLVLNKASESLRGPMPDTFESGEERRRWLQAQVSQKKICPSWPHSCMGTCDAAKLHHGEISKVKEKGV